MAEPKIIPPGSKRGTGFVYFLLATDNMVRPMMKIGFSLRAPDGRRNNCQTGSPVPLRLIGFVTGDRHYERELHQRFAALRSQGEWFFYDGALKEHVEELDA